MIPGIFLVIALSAVIPGSWGSAIDHAWARNAGIFGIFLLQGLSLDLKQLGGWGRQLERVAWVLAGNFVLLPIIGWLLVKALPLPPAIAIGLAFLSVLPTTVTSAVAIATENGGDRVMALMATAVSNLASVLLTPALMSLYLAQSQGGSGDFWGLIEELFFLLALPLLLGTWLRTFPAVRPYATPWWAAYFNLGVILYLLFLAMARSVAQGVWADLSRGEAIAAGGSAVLLFAGGQLALWVIARLRRMEEPQRISLLITGGQKSLATGIPIATLLFGPTVWAEQLGLILMPLLICHPLQLLAHSQWPRARGA